LALAAAGCTAGTRIHVLPVEAYKLSAEGPLLIRYDVGEGWYWYGDDDRLRVVFSHGTLAKPGSWAYRSFEMSLLLGPRPANLGRYYAVDRGTLRAMIRDGSQSRRHASLYGIVGVSLTPGSDVLHGRFRIWAKEQDFRIWRGWGADTRVLFVGEFTARLDARRGAALWSRTDSGGLQRPPPNQLPPPTPQPVPIRPVPPPPEPPPAQP